MPPAISKKTRAQIKGYLEGFVEHVVEKYKDRSIPVFSDPAAYLKRSSKQGQLKPFHAAIIPPELMRLNEFERGFSTTLGTTFEECAKLIALEHHAESRRGHAITGYISKTALDEIENQVAQFERAVQEGEKRPSWEQMIRKVSARRKGKERVARTAKADLFVRDHDGTEYYFEMKSPVPNRGQCLEVMQRMLRIQLLREDASSNVKTFFAMAYNPFGADRQSYSWSIARSYLPFDQITLIGDEFWTLVGGSSTYAELLSIYREVGHEKAKYILDNLAFGF